MRRFLFLALLMAGLVLSAPYAHAVSPDPDNSSGIDLHSNAVVEGLAVGIADTTSGNTVQVGPVGGLFDGAVSVEQAFGRNATTTIYSGACVLEGVAFTPDTADDYIELYDGTARGNRTNCLLDIQGHTADDTKIISKWPIECTTGLVAYTTDGVAQVRYRIEDQSE